MIQYITSKTNNRIKELLKLRKSQEREKEQVFLVEGFHMLEMALKEEAVMEVYSLEPLKLADSIDQFIVTKEIMDKITVSKSAQGVVSKCRYLKAKEVTQDKILYLDDIQDPGNLGTILRTALAFNYLDVILSPHTVSCYNDKVLAATQGAIFSLNILVQNHDFIWKLQEKGYQVLATSLQDASDISKVNIDNKIVIVLGNEAQGVSKDILEKCDKKVVIPIQNIDSLNVGVASGIIMYYLQNK